MTADTDLQSKRMTYDAILMASGFSRRFGARDKLLQDFRGKPLALHTLLLVCGMPEFANVFFVAASPEVAKLAEGTRARVIRNNAPERGMCESIRLGAEASSAEFYCFFQCDQPLLDASAVRKLLAAAKPGAIAEPVAGGRRRSPSLFSKAFREELLSLRDGEGGSIIKERHGDAVVSVVFDDVAIFADIDTPEGLLQLETKNERIIAREDVLRREINAIMAEIEGD